MIIPGLVHPDAFKDYDPSKAGGALNPRMRTAGDAAVLFEEQFEGALTWSISDIKERGTMMNMLEDYKKKTGTDGK